MNDLIGLWFGFLGIVVGAIITFLTEVMMRKGQMQFDISIKVRETLLDLNNKLVETHSKVLSEYDDSDRINHAKNIISLKVRHKEIMELYKVFRIHLGDLKAYELDSAIFNYYYELAKNSSTKIFTFEDYKWAFTALKHSAGFMINAVRFELVKINSIKKIKKEDNAYKQSEYIRYSKSILKWLNLENSSLLFNEFEPIEDSTDPIYKSIETIVARVCPFYNEMKTFEKNTSLPDYIQCKG